MKKYKYFVTYSCNSSTGLFGYGNCDVIRSHRFQGAPDAQTIARQVEHDLDVPENSVIVLFIQFIGTV